MSENKPLSGLEPKPREIRGEDLLLISQETSTGWVSGSVTIAEFFAEVFSAGGVADGRLSDIENDIEDLVDRFDKHENPLLETEIEDFDPHDGFYLRKVHLNGDDSGLSGDGREENPLSLDKEFMEIRYIPSDTIAVTTIGDLGDTTLPISGSYYSIARPRGDDCASIGFIEANGDLSVLNQVSNGEDKRVTYGGIRNWIQLGVDGTPYSTDSIYSPPVLLPGEYVFNCMGISPTAMLCEIHEDRTSGEPVQGSKILSFKEHAIVKLNDTLNHDAHEVIRLGTALLDNHPIYGGTNLDVRTLITRSPPSPFIVNGNIYLLFPNTIVSGQNPMKWWLYSVSETGVLTKMTGIKTTSPRGEFTEDYINIFSVGMSTDVTVTDTLGYMLDSGLVLTGAYVMQPYIIQNGNNVRIMATLSKVARNNITARAVIMSKTFVFDVNVTAKTVKEVKQPGVDDYIRVDANASGDPILVSTYGTFWAFSTGWGESRWQPLNDGSGFMTSSNAGENRDQSWFAKKNTTGVGIWEITSNLIKYGSDGGQTDVINYRGNLIPPTVVHPYSTGQLIGDNVLVWDVSPNIPTSVKTVGLCKLTGASNAATYKLLDFETPIKGYVLNNNRVALPDELTRSRNLLNPVNTFVHPSGAVRYSRTTFLSGAVNNTLEQDRNINNNFVANTEKLKITPAVSTSLSQSINVRYAGESHSWRLHVMEDGENNKAVIQGLSLSLGSPNNRITYFVCMASITIINGEITAATPNWTTAYEYAADTISARFSDSASSPYNYCAVKKESDGTYLIGLQAQYISGAGRSSHRGLWIAKPGQPIIMVTNNPTTGVYSGHPTLGFGIVTSNYGYGTMYTFEKIVSHEPYTLAEPIVLTSPRPAKTFTVAVTTEFKAFINGRLYMVKPDVIDLYSVDPDPRNKKFNIYIKLSMGEAFVVVQPATNILAETQFTVYVGYLITNSENIMLLEAEPVYRLGLFRPSTQPAGSAFPVSSGHPSAPAYTTWGQTANGQPGDPTTAIAAQLGVGSVHYTRLPPTDYNPSVAFYSYFGKDTRWVWWVVGNETPMGETGLSLTGLDAEAVEVTRNQITGQSYYNPPVAGVATNATTDVWESFPERRYTITDNGDGTSTVTDTGFVNGVNVDILNPYTVSGGGVVATTSTSTSNVYGWMRLPDDV